MKQIDPGPKLSYLRRMTRRGRVESRRKMRAIRAGEQVRLNHCSPVGELPHGRLGANNRERKKPRCRSVSICAYVA